MKYYVNEQCIGCGMCNALCPSVFEMNENGLAEAVDNDVDEADINDAQEAVDSCPVGAIEER